LDNNVFDIIDARCNHEVLFSVAYHYLIAISYPIHTIEHILLFLGIVKIKMPTVTYVY